MMSQDSEKMIRQILGGAAHRALNLIPLRKTFFEFIENPALQPKTLEEYKELFRFPVRVMKDTYSEAYLLSRHSKKCSKLTSVFLAGVLGTVTNLAEISPLKAFGVAKQRHLVSPGVFERLASDRYGENGRLAYRLYPSRGHQDENNEILSTAPILEQ